MRKWEKVLGALIGIVILLFIVRNLKTGLEQLGSYELNISFRRVVFSFSVFLALFPLYAKLWQVILTRLGFTISFAKSMKIWFLSQAGRYIPGKVWFALGRIYLCERESIPRAAASVAIGVEILLVLASSIVVFAVGWVGTFTITWQYLMVLIAVPAILVGIHPRILKYILRKIGRVPEHFRMRYKDLVAIFCVYVVCWCIYGTGFYLLSSSITLDGADLIDSQGQEVQLVARLTAINAISWSAGLVSVVTPAGLGVREGVSSILLSKLLPRPYPSLIPLAARLWVTIAEVATIVLVLVMRRG